MEVLLNLYGSLLPYLAFIPLGYFLSRREILRVKWLAVPLLYVFLPLLVIDHVLEASFTFLITLALITFLFSSLMNIPGRIVHPRLAPRENRNILQSGFSFFNVVFFGIPTITALFGKQALTALICIYIGSAFYGNVFGYLQVARSRFSLKKSISEVFKVPFLYAFLLALILKFWGTELPSGTAVYFTWIGKVASAFGLTILGMNLTAVDFKDLQLLYYGKILAVRTASAIAIMAVLMSFEYYFFDNLNSQARNVLMVIPLFPVAANLTLFASFLKSKERQAALLVLLSTVLALILVPLFAFFI
jgi:hypothetical protein